jgi:hypothetical protein
MMQEEWKRICENCMCKETWKSHNKMSFCWAFYYVNYNQIIDPNSPKMMCCIICYISLILISNPEIQTRNDLNSITYHKRNNCIEKNVSTNDYVLPKSF